MGSDGFFIYTMGEWRGGYCPYGIRWKETGLTVGLSMVIAKL